MPIVFCKFWAFQSKKLEGMLYSMPPALKMKRHNIHPCLNGITASYMISMTLKSNFNLGLPVHLVVFPNLLSFYSIISIHFCTWGVSYYLLLLHKRCYQLAQWSTFVVTENKVAYNVTLIICIADVIWSNCQIVNRVCLVHDNHKLLLTNQKS